MYHSVTFFDNDGSKNSYSDWHLVPDSRPVIAMPEQKKEIVDVPGGNGVLDMSMALTKFPIYNRRSGSLKFHVLNDYINWKDLYEEIAMYLHGQSKSMWLEDDPTYFYVGYFTVTWTSNNDGTWSDVEIGYDLEPYKYARTVSYFGNAFVLSKNGTGNGDYTMPSSIADPSLPTPLLVETSECTNNPKLGVGFINNYLSISEAAVKQVSNGSGAFTTPHLITTNGQHGIRKFPICGKTKSNMTNIHVLLNVNTLSANSAASIKIKLGFRRAKL